MSKFESDIYDIYNKKTPKTTRSGINFLELLLIAFIVLKLCKVITWSWWWVLSPIWIPLCLWVVFVIIITLIKCFRRRY